MRGSTAVSVTSTVTGIYAYSGTVASLYAGGLLSIGLLNGTSASDPGTFVDNNGQLSQSDDGLTTFSLNGGAAQPIDYLGSGTVATVGFLGIQLGSKPVAVFSVGGQIYLYAPQGLPLLSALSMSFSIDPDATFNLPSPGADGTVHGLDTGQAMAVNYTDLQGDKITNTGSTVLGNGGDDTITAGTGADLVYGGTGNDTLYGGDGADTLSGDAGNDTLFGGIGNDALSGGQGSDTLSGGDGADTLTGDTGNDTLTGGTGTDRAVFSGPVEQYTFTYGPGGELIVTDTVADRDGTDVLSGVEEASFGGQVFTLVTGDNGQNLTLQNVDPTQFTLIIAFDGNDWGGGHATSDAIFGGSGDDLLEGGDGNDTLFGDGGNDTLFGGDGSDTLSGGAGNDRLTGGAGRDIFALSDDGGDDLVTDFDLTDAGGGFTADQLDTSALRTPGGDPVTAFDVVTMDDGSGNARLVFPGGETVVLQGVDPSQMATAGQRYRAGIPCFTTGTAILTPQGPRAIEVLRPGDLVVTRHDGPQPIVWIGRRRLSQTEVMQAPHLRPVRIAPGVAGNTRPLLVSPQHAVLVTCGGGESLVRAVHLARLPGGAARVVRRSRPVTYVHLLFDRHQIVQSNGVWTESFYPGPQALATLDQPEVAELLTLFPDLARGAAAAIGGMARNMLKPRDLKLAHSASDCLAGEGW